MLLNLKIRISLKLFVLLLAFSDVIAHPGRQDSNGGHFNRKTNEYHCHSNKCASTHDQAKAALTEAKENRHKFSLVYDRSDWPHWIDEDGDCQNARAEALIKASQIPVKFKRNKGCVVSHGQWFDPYSGQTFTQASKLDIDHIVPLKEAHVSGAANWSRAKKRAFANDPINLIVVSAKENREKGAKDPNHWLPDETGFHCGYIKRWDEVKVKYSLSMDSSEKAIISSYKTCTAQ